jgi:DNA polymerase I
MIKNYGTITTVAELSEYIDRIGDQVFAGDVETGYHGPDREKGALHPETALLAGISFTTSTDWARYVPLGHDEGENVDTHEAARLFWPLLRKGNMVAHNAAFELRHLSKWFRENLSDDPEYGEQVRASNGYFPIRSDTQVEAYLLAEYQRFGLKYLTKEMFGHQMTELAELFPHLPKNKLKFLRFNTLPLTPKEIEYACEDSVWCLAIHEKYHPQISETLLYKVEMAIVQNVVPRMEDEGVCYDWALMRRTADKLRAFRDKFNAEIMQVLSDLAGKPIAVNLASPPQIADVLFNTLGYRTNVYTDKTRDLPPDERKMSTGKIALERLAQEYPVVQKIREWKQITRLLGTYLDKYEKLYNYAEDGRAHPNLLSAFVITGRFAVSDPPIQQSPKKYHYDLAAALPFHAAHRDRHGKPDGKSWCACDDPEFMPPSGTCFKFNFRDVITAPLDHYILGFDLSQAELRAIAGEAQETALLEAFANGDDVHRLTASLMLGVPVDQITDEQRSIGKTMNFALLYGMGVKSLGDRLGIPIEEAQALMDKYFAGMSNIAAYMAKQVEHGKRLGYVTSKFKRKLPIWEYLSDKRWIYQKGDRACVNYPIQGAATGDYMKIAMVRVVAVIQKAGLADKIKLVMNIHDALEFYVHKSLQPQDVIALLKDAVIFPVSGWPAMKADWHVAKRWGSPMDVTVNDDGSLTVKGDKVYELAPSIEEDEDGDAVEVLPEVDREVLRDAVSYQGAARRVVLTLPQMPKPDAWLQFTNLLDALPGDNDLTVATPEGELDYPYLSGINTAHIGRVNALFPGATITYVHAPDTIERLSVGLDL